jgi:two-component system alkaline phosphatase synthesis response regulator PhoP
MVFTPFLKNSREEMMPHVVLVVEQNTDLRANISHILRRQGYFVFAVRDGELALEVAEDNPISLVIIDSASLQADEFEICLRLRTSVKTAHVPLLMLVEDEDGMIQMNKHGFRANSFLQRPFTWEEFMTRVQFLLQSTKRVRQKILVIEHDAQRRNDLALSLLREGYLVLTPDDSTQTLEVALSNSPALVILDVVSLQPDGIDICRQLRSCSETASVPILLLINNISEIALIELAGVHADDYLVKPYIWEELRACVRTLLRSGKRGVKPKRAVTVFKPQTSTKKGEMLVADELTIDVDQQLVIRGDQQIWLDNSAVLFALLLYLVRRRGAAVSRDELLRQIWGSENAVHKHTVDVHIHLLRQKLQDDLDHPQLIQTVPGVGYRFKS